MTPLFHPHLINGPCGDPALYIDFLFQRRALMFDLGELSALPPRRALRLSDVFISHAHMDHFIGFDTLLRLLLGRDAHLRLHGPPGLIEHAGHHLQGYTWNLLHNYTTELVFEVSEFAADGRHARARFRSGDNFRRQDVAPPAFAGGVLLDEPGFRIRAAQLDHGIPCLGFMLEEKTHINVWRNRLDALGLPTGPWLAHLKRLVREEAPDDTPVEIAWHDRHGEHRRELPLGYLRQEVLQETRGQKIAYVTDVAFHEANRRAIVALARGADLFYIEAPFLDAAAPRAAATAHLTARQAGRLAREAGVRRVIPFHFSPRHSGDEPVLEAEVLAAFDGY
ncbi:ribonuclease Z [Thioalkalivibrio thiocyanoxidans]|uniref:ribonuclease Z n=1 Tax=Thioalkalivibrio thiocyanoxidans TaxID=152475 RepID=UPI000382EEF9|nr:MBL fold metallo-hydrolase [Thioalkalivibrio thiocyanoxidans]